MSQRIIRVNELIQRELGDILRRHYQSEAVAITITEVRVSPDLRDGRVFVSVVGDEDTVQDRLRWLRREAPAKRTEQPGNDGLAHFGSHFFSPAMTGKGSQFSGGGSGQVANGVKAQGGL